MAFRPQGEEAHLIRLERGIERIGERLGAIEESQRWVRDSLNKIDLAINGVGGLNSEVSSLKSRVQALEADKATEPENKGLLFQSAAVWVAALGVLITLAIGSVNLWVNTHPAGDRYEQRR